MEIDRRALKRQARERMALTDPKFWVVALAYIAMTTGVAWLFSLVPTPGTGSSPVPFIDTVQIFLQLLLILYQTVVQFGLCLWALWTWRQLDPGVSSLMQGFSVAGRVLLMELSILFRTLGWYFPVALALSVPFTMVLVGVGDYGTRWIFVLLFVICLFIALYAISLRYALAPYLLADRPDDGFSIPILRSVELMRGWKMELFKLELSFIGWELINLALSFSVLLLCLSRAGLLTPEAILMETWLDQLTDVIYSTPTVILRTLVTVPVSLWLIPYRSVSEAGFYDARLMAAQDRLQLPEMPPL
ncbi:MAG: DUF975 family protein [Lawsonibacter sp.]|jgi:uncharacterized membrane protein|nr:DUF975 family protein [Lawsonibacter sp.]